MCETILDQDCESARKFFLKAKSYCNFDLPPYFNFQSLLDNLAGCMEIPDKVPESKKNKAVKACQLLTSKFRNIPKNVVNYELFTNKDGKFSWRPLELINPIAYVYLVKLITEEEAWGQIISRFGAFRENKRIVCHSMPLVREKPNQKATNISNWYENFEKETIKQALNYDYMFVTDISNCYSSIYTHSIAWALHPDGEQGAKKNRQDVRLICNAIDSIVQHISYSQTDGIPQGSVLMDFVAEIVLGYADLLLSEKIGNDREIGKTSYYIMRYRDDYRIFTKEKEIAERIARYLSEVLAHLNLKLNSEKTFLTDDIIIDAQKSDKLFWRDIHKSKDLNIITLQIHSLSRKYPNSGSIAKGLTKIYDMIGECSNINEVDLKLIFSVIVDIAYRNPRTYPLTIGILGEILSKYPLNERRKLVKALKEKFKKVPNSEYFYIWLQRLNKEVPKSMLGEGRLCDYIRKSIEERGKLKVSIEEIWDYSTLRVSSKKSTNIKNTLEPNEPEETPSEIKYEEILKIMDNASIFDFASYKDMTKYPEAKEVKVFGKYF